MKKVIFFLAFFSVCQRGVGQGYTPMPADSAVWRYRVYDIDFITKVVDFILFVNGTDSLASNGNTYHKIISRSFSRVEPNNYIPPVVPVSASYSDQTYGAFRESGKKVFLLTLFGDQLIYDFNVAIGDSIPAFGGKKEVVAIDSIMLGDGYHKRFLTTNPAYYVIEGVGSSQGFIPDLNDGFGTTQFMCFTHLPVVYLPDNSIPCTYVYQIGTSAIHGVNDLQPQIRIFPVPANDLLHITLSERYALEATIFNDIGQSMWRGIINDRQDIRISRWGRGVYYVKFTGREGQSIIRKIILQ